MGTGRAPAKGLDLAKALLLQNLQSMMALNSKLKVIARSIAVAVSVAGVARADCECRDIVSFLGREFTLHVPPYHRVYDGIEVLAKTSRGYKSIPPLTNDEAAPVLKMSEAFGAPAIPIEVSERIRISYESLARLASKLSTLFEVLGDMRSRKDFMTMEFAPQASAHLSTLESVYFDSHDSRRVPHGGSLHSSIAWVGQYAAVDGPGIRLPKTAQLIVETPRVGGVLIGNPRPPIPPEIVPQASDPVYFYKFLKWQQDVDPQEGADQIVVAARNLYLIAASELPERDRSGAYHPYFLLDEDLKLVPNLRITTQQIRLELVYYDPMGERFPIGTVGFDFSYSADVSNRGRLPVSHAEIVIQLGNILPLEISSQTLAPRAFFDTLYKYLPAHTYSKGENQNKFVTAHRLLSDYYNREEE